MLKAWWDAHVWELIVDGSMVGVVLLVALLVFIFSKPKGERR